jgi:hypothetical protein
MPERRIFGPSAHQIGPSPSPDRTGVQMKDEPAAMIAVMARSIRLQ